MNALPSTETVSADFVLTFEEFAEGYKLQRSRRRFLSGPPESSPWVGCGVMAGLFVALLVALVIAIALTGTTQTTTSGTTVTPDTPVVEFLSGLLPFPIAAGVLWIIAARSISERRILRRALVILLLIGAAQSLSVTLAPAQPASANEQSLGWGFLPFIVGLIGLVVVLLDIRRNTVRVAWDGQPQLRQPVHIEASPDRWLSVTPLVRSEYVWQAVISYSEGKDVFLLSYSAMTFHIIPKRAFDAPGIEAFRAMLTTRAVNADSKPPTGFDVIPQPVLPLSAQPPD